MADDKKYKLTCFTEGDKSTFSVLVSRDSEVRLLYCVKRENSTGLIFVSWDLVFLKVCQAFHAWT
jgi:hypothetical protein